MKLDELTKKIADLPPEEKRKLEELLLNDRGINKANETIVPRRSSEPAPLSFSQSRLWFLDQYESGKPIYNIPAAFRLNGKLNIAALESALRAIVARHEVLRTTYELQNDQPVQVIHPNLDFKLEVDDLQIYPLEIREHTLREAIQSIAHKPFDLTKGVFRWVLFCLAPETHILLTVIHHIASDGWSQEVFNSELSRLYAGFASGNDCELPDLVIQYADFAIWQHEWLQDAVFDDQLRYWKNQLAGSSILTLPLDQPRPALQSHPGAAENFFISTQITRKLVQIGRDQRATTFMVLITAINILLARYSGQFDINVGIPIANRTRTEIENLIGFFINTLVIRTNLVGNPSFKTLLERVRKTTLEAYSNQDLPFEKLVSHVRPERDLSQSPLFQVLITYQNVPQKPLQLSGLRVEKFELERKVSKFDLEFEFKDSNEGLAGKLTYNTDLFLPITIQGFISHFHQIVDVVLAAPDQPIGNFSLLTPTEKDQILSKWNDTEVPFAADLSFVDLFVSQVKRNPDEIAVVHRDLRLTYRELDERSNQLAQYLRTLGVGPEVFVAISIPRSPEMVIGLVGILKSGGAYIPIDATYPAERNQFILEDTAAPILLVSGNNRPDLNAFNGTIVDFEADWGQISKQPVTQPEVQIWPANLAYVIYTSGSSGQPKGVALQHHSLTAFLNWARRTFSPEDIKAVLAATSISFDISVFEILVPLVSGGKCILINNLLDLIDEDIRSEVTLINSVPSGLRELITQDKIPASVRVINSCGEFLPRELCKQLYRGGQIDKVYESLCRISSGSSPSLGL